MNELKRGQKVALIGAGLQVLLAVLAVILWRSTGSSALLTSWWLLLGGVPVWVMTAVLFYARDLAAREAQELEELQSSGDQSRLFSEAERLEQRPAARRVTMMERWAVRVLTLGMAAYHLVIAWWMFNVLRSADSVLLKGTGPAAAFLALSIVVSFLYSRYCTGMAKTKTWSLLRPAGAYLLICMIVNGCLFIAMLASTAYPLAEAWVAFVAPGIMFIYGLEMILGFILDLYRPHIPGAEYRPAYESRLLNLLSEFGRVGHSIADTINYQFGFEVSGTWFYQLVSKAIVPLLIFGVLVLLLASSFVIVEEGEACIVKVLGRPIEGPHGAKMLGPGGHWKWPWPVATTERIEVGRIHTVVLGVGQERAAAKDRFGRNLIVWSEDHGYGGRAETDFLIAVPKAQQKQREQDGLDGQAAYAVNVIRLVVSIQYRIDDAYEWAYNSSDSASLLKSLANEVMTEYCASATLDDKVSDESQRPQAIMTWGREAAASNLQKRIQSRIDRAKLGAKIMFVGIVSAHPPTSVIPDYEKVLEAERDQDKQRYQAQSRAAQILAAVAGQPANALKLYLSIHVERVLRTLQKEQSDPVRFNSSLAEYSRRTAEQIEALNLELTREQQLGRKTDDKDSEPIEQQLKRRYGALASQLKAIGAKPKSYDYATAIAAASAQTESLFERLDGEPAKRIAEARAARWQKEQTAWTAVETYRRTLLPYQACPEVYRFDRIMDIYDELLPKIKVYVLSGDSKDVEIRMNLEEPPGDFQQGMAEALQGN